MANTEPKNDILAFTKSYLLVLGVPEEKVNENLTKIFISIILSSAENLTNTDEVLEKKELIQSLSVEDKEKTMAALQDLLKNNISGEGWQKELAKELANYLIDMTDKLGDSLTEEKKKELAGLINNFSA
jgi:hypothetical protein